MFFFSNQQSFSCSGRRLTGLPRFTELLDRDLSKLFLTGLAALAGCLPFIIGTFTALLTTSLLILIPSCIIGGALVGPSLCILYDAVYRSLRDAPGKCAEHIMRAWKQNWRQAVLPGICFCLLTGFYLFALLLMWLTPGFAGYGTVCILIVGILIIIMFFSIFWPQLVLFEQTRQQLFSNCILFILKNFWKTLGCAILQIAYSISMILFLPWSIILLPVSGLWFILFLTNFLLYNSMNEAFRIEEEIAMACPEQAAYYEDDNTWLKRRQEEQSKSTDCNFP